MWSLMMWQSIDPITPLTDLELTVLLLNSVSSSLGMERELTAKDLVSLRLMCFLVVPRASTFHPQDISILLRSWISLSESEKETRAHSMWDSLSTMTRI